MPLRNGNVNFCSTATTDACIDVELAMATAQCHNGVWRKLNSAPALHVPCSIREYDTQLAVTISKCRCSNDLTVPHMRTMFVGIQRGPLSDVKSLATPNRRGVQPVWAASAHVQMVCSSDLQQETARSQQHKCLQNTARAACIVIKTGRDEVRSEVAFNSQPAGQCWAMRIESTCTRVHAMPIACNVCDEATCHCVSRH